MKNLTQVAVALLVPIAIVVAILGWLGSGYGEVSPDAYRVAQALYGCCLAKSEPRLELVESLLEAVDDPQALEITTQERQWLAAMVAQAKEGDWQMAAKAARRMLENQVQH